LSRSKEEMKFVWQTDDMTQLNNNVLLCLV
jgi:hypothetical protein